MSQYITNRQLEKLANGKGVKEVAVWNFVGTCDNCGSRMYANMNLNEDARMYKWNQATINAIKKGIDIVYDNMMKTRQDVEKIPDVSPAGERIVK